MKLNGIKGIFCDCLMISLNLHLRIRLLFLFPGEDLKGFPDLVFHLQTWGFRIKNKSHKSGLSSAAAIIFSDSRIPHILIAGFIRRSDFRFLINFEALFPGSSDFMKFSPIRKASYPFLKYDYFFRCLKTAFRYLKAFLRQMLKKLI